MLRLNIASLALLLLFAPPASSDSSAPPHTEMTTETDSSNRSTRSPDEDALRRMRQYLTTADTLEFTTSYTSVDKALGSSASGTVHYLLRKPNLVRVSAKTSDGRVEVYSDGKILTIHRLAEREFRRSPASDDILGTLYKAAGVMALPTRMFDFFWSVDFISRFDEPANLSKLKAQTFDGSTCDGFKLAYSDDIWSVWLDRSVNRLPCRLVSRRIDTSSVTVQTNNFKWNTKPKATKEAFRFTPPKGHKEVGLGSYLKPAD